VSVNTKPFWSDYGNPYDLVIEDQDGALGIELGVYGAPETFLLNATGDVLYKRVGDVNSRIWTNEILPRLEAMAAVQ
jgi:cytochrome c biogenesis protein CcmG/thiol:disulfide interchange protein DsbE